jgi:hypothetical protein
MSSETFKTSERNNLEKLYNLDLPKEPETINQESIENNQTTIPQNNLEKLYENTAAPEISNLEKLEYGWDKTTNVVGNVFRIGKAKFQDILDDDKTFEDYILLNEKTRQDEINKEHWKFVGNEDAKDSGLVKVGEALTYITDPYYIGGYYFGAKALTNPLTSAALNAALIAGDSAIDQLAKTGKIDTKQVATAGAIGGTIGAVLPIGGKLVKKLFPKATEKQVKLISDWLDNKIAKKNNLTVPELKTIQAAANNKAVQEADKQIVKWNRNFVAPIAKEEGKFLALEKTLLNKRNALIESRKQLKDLIKGQEKKFEFKIGKGDSVLKKTRSEIKNISKNVVNIRKEIIKARTATDKVKNELIKKQQVKLQKWAELVANRDTKILETLKASQSFTDKAVTSLLSATVKPLVGAGAGAVFGTLFGDDETDLMYWAAAGAFAGQMQKMIQRSAKFGTQAEKGKILGLIDREMTQLTMQKVRSLLASTSATKLNSYGGATEKISRMLLRDVDSSVQEKSVIAVAEQMERYFYRKAANLVKGFTDDEIALAVSINRGKQITKDTPQKIINLSNNIKSYLDEVKTLHSDAGFFAKKELADYFPRVLNWDKINRDPEKFRTTLESIYKSLDFKDPKKAADQYISGHRVAGDSVFNRQIMETIFGVGAKKGVSKEGKKFIYTPVSDHIMHERSLVGPYKLVEEVLEKNGYLVNDAAYILSNLVNKSVKSIAFARQFGTNGELLQPLFQQIKNKYSKSGLKTEAANKAAIKESNLVIDTIDSYFDRYGQKLYGAASGSASILATLSNLNMLGRVTISSLGDLIQPFQNSSQFKSIVKGWMQTSRTAKNETGLAKALNYDINNELQKALIRSAGIGEGDVVNATRWMGIKNPTQTLNNAFFKGLGLQWLTGYARRFAYNTGTADAYYLSKQLYNIVNKGAGINSNKAQRVINFLQKYGINSRQGLQIGEVKSFNETIKISANKKLLEQAGIITANRDALIPQVSNRLLFTQNQNQWIRIWGQFLSWAMAKSAQTNKILARIENGNAKTLVKTLAVLPLYSGVQSLRELAKHGEVVTDYTANNKKWWAEGGRLSGMIGWLPELVANRFVGPGSREPWYAFAPFFQTITAPIDAAYQGFFKGNKDRALQIISNKIAPLPNWRRLFSRLFSRGPKEIQTGTNFSGGELKPFSVGGAVAKAVTKNIIDRSKTAITTTTGTYTKANKILTDLNKKTVHDFGSGKGVGTKEFKNKIVTSHEPFVSDEAILKAGGKLPDYKNVKDLFKVEGANSKDSVVNLNVLNVIENVSERVKVVDQIGKLLNKDGVAIITTRGDDVLNQAKKSKNAIKYLDGFLFGGKEKTFQKGYNQKELELFIKTVLGDNFKIEKIPSKYKINTSGVIIKKIKDSFNTGGEVIVPPKKPDLESQLSDAMKIDTTTGEGANINVIEEKKSNVDKQVEKATKKDYSKLPDLDENKKNFLLDTAKTIFTNNRENSVPNDVLLSIAIEETGYGEGRFYKQGNNLFSLVAEKGDERIKAKGDETVVAKFENPSGSINKFYSWVDNKPHYQIVRDTIQLYNEGKASKEDIIDAISSTGWAENKDWSSNVKSILKKRVDGKHKDELQKLADSLFSE